MFTGNSHSHPDAGILNNFCINNFSKIILLGLHIPDSHTKYCNELFSISLSN